MKVIVVGNGGREHSIAWKLLQSPQITKVLCVPGNGGTASLPGCTNVPLKVDDFVGIKHLAIEQAVSLVVIGPELPLALGITDYLQTNLRTSNLAVFGPNQQGAMLEGSKSWAKELMAEAGIPTAQSGTFRDATEAKAYIQTTPIVVKVDGLAAGKGVTVATTVEMAHQAIDDIFQGKFGPNPRVVIEEFLEGQEVSLLALTDGKTIRPLVPAQDHKQIGEGDTGPNTGGMGVYAPTPIINQDLLTKLTDDVLQPTLTALQNRGIDYRGVIYAGLMITPQGEAKVLEFNCRFGDPETQAILPLLETPLVDLLLACSQQRLGEMPPLSWYQGVSLCVVLAADGYPGDYPKGDRITGIEAAEALGVQVFHAGTKVNEQDQIVTDGGRVLGVTAIASSFPEAKVKVYQAIDRIHFQGMYYRRDIGHRVYR